jgi:YVTN family beta-propeller protein
MQAISQGAAGPDVVDPRRKVWLAIGIVALMLVGGFGALSYGHSMASAPPGPSGSASARALAQTLPAAAPPLSALPARSAPRAVPSIPGVTGGNSSPIPEAGSVLAPVTAGSEPYGVGVNAVTGYAYITNAHSNNVTIISGTKVIANVAVGKTPEGAIYNPKNELMYITNAGSNNITLINGTKVVGWITDASFDEPFQGAYNPSNEYLYITNVAGSVVTVLSGLHVVGTVATGHYPFGAAYDPANQNIYVTNTATVSQGGSSVTIINKMAVVTTLAAGTPANFTNPSSVVYDASNGYIYVANKDVASPSHSFETLISNQTIVGTFRAGHDVYGEAYDPANGFVYAPSSDTDIFSFNPAIDNLTVLNGSSLITNITAGQDSMLVAYDPVNFCLYIANEGNTFLTTGGSVTIVFALLGEGPMSAAPLGNPVGSLDVGQSVGFTAPLYATGVAPDTPKVAVQPDAGFRCQSPTIVTTGLNAENLSTSCTPTIPGNYTIWLNVTDGLSKTVNSWIDWVVYPDPVASVPVALLGSGEAVTAVDAGQLVNISVSYQPGSGLADALSWTGFPTGTCQATGPADINDNFTCRFGIANNLTISATFNDTNGEMAASPPLHLLIYPHLAAGIPAADPGSADVNEPAVFSATVSGGTGAYTAFLWSGLSAGTCSSLTARTVTCTFPDVGIETVSMTVTDSNGITATSLALTFVISPTLSTATPTANRTSVDVGQTMHFTASSSGGSGKYSYAWTGLPLDCTQANTSSPTCLMDAAGVVAARVTAVDTNGVRVGPTAPVNVTVYADPMLGSIIVAPRSVPEGSPVTLAVAVAGGSGSDRYTWINLPTGCASTNASEITCKPAATGVFDVAVNAVDSNGWLALGNETNLTVTSASSSSSGSLSGGGTLFLGIAVIAILVAVAEAAILLRKRK